MFCWTPLPRLPEERSYLIWGAFIINNSSFQNVGHTRAEQSEVALSLPEVFCTSLQFLVMEPQSN